MNRHFNDHKKILSSFVLFVRFCTMLMPSPATAAQIYLKVQWYNVTLTLIKVSHEPYSVQKKTAFPRQLKTHKKNPIKIQV